MLKFKISNEYRDMFLLIIITLPSHILSKLLFLNVKDQRHQN